MESEAERLHRAIGQQLRTLREDRGLTQERLAAEAGVHRTFVGKVERGESAVTVDSVAVFCSALDLSLAEFFRSLDQEFAVSGPRLNQE